MICVKRRLLVGGILNLDAAKCLKQSSTFSAIDAFWFFLNMSTNALILGYLMRFEDFGFRFSLTFNATDKIRLGK